MHTYPLAKRTLDVVLATVGLLVCGWLVVVAAIAARIDTGASGLFVQLRIGRNGQMFCLYKIRSMRPTSQSTSTVTTANDSRVTRLGRWLRRLKIDELPQLWNVLRGDMSLVGPRPEVPAYLSTIRQLAPETLRVRPGITGPATLKYRHEEQLLAQQDDPIAYNDQVVFPDKLRINSVYVQKARLADDLRCLWYTLVPSGRAGYERFERDACETTTRIAA